TPGKLGGSRRRPPACPAPSGHERASGPCVASRIDALNGRPFRQGGDDCLGCGWRPGLKNDLAVSIDDTDMRLFHRDVQSSKLLHGSSLRHIGKILSTVREQPPNYPMLKISENKGRQKIGVWSCRADGATR